MKHLKEPTSKFLRVRCECKNEQVIFSRAASNVNCLVCNKPLAKPTGGSADVTGRVLDVLH